MTDINTEPLKDTCAEQPLSKQNGKRVLYAALLLLAVSLACGLFAAFFPWRDRPEKAARFDPVTTVRGSYVYLDLVSISGRLIRDDSSDNARFYHSAEDQYGYFYIVRMQASDLNRFPAQYRQGTGGSQDVPEPYRVYGKAVQMTGSDRKKIAGVWDIEPGQVVDYFGHKCIDIDMSPAKDRKTVCGIFSIAAFAAAVCLFIVYRYSSCLAR